MRVFTDMILNMNCQNRQKNVLKNGPSTDHLKSVKRETTSAVFNCNIINLTIYNYLFYLMSKVTTISVLLLVAFAVLSSAQSYNDILGNPEYVATDGALYKHIYVGTVYIVPATPPTNTDTQTVVSVLPNQIFDSTETISYATAIKNIEGATSDPVSKELILQIDKIVINAPRTQFTIYVKFNRNGLSTYSSYNKLGFQVILIGSNFNTQAGGLSAAFARNGQLADALPQNNLAAQSKQFNFAGTQGEPSPFAFTPSISRCGVSLLSGWPVVQLFGCAKTIFLTFITGFNFINLSANDNNFYMSSFVVTDRTVTAPPSAIIPNLQLSAASPDYIYMVDNTDTVYGPTVMFKAQLPPVSPSALIRIQLSFVFVALSQFTATTYPASSTDAFIVAVGGGRYPLASNKLSKDPASASDGLITTNANLDINLYNPFSNMGHMFCGLTALTQRRSTGITTSFVLTPATGPKPATNILNLADSQSKTGSTESSAVCILFAAKATFTADQTLVSEVSYSSTTSNNAITVTNNNLKPANKFNPAKNLYAFTVTGYTQLNTPSSITITKNYPIPPTATEVAAYFQLDTIGNPATQISVITDIAGFSYTQMLNTITATLSYFVHVPLGTTSVTVTFTVNISPVSGGSTSLSILMGLAYQNIVIQPSGFGKNCPEVDGKTTGVNPTTNPPTCIYCSTALNLYYSNGQCICKDYYYLSSGVCRPCTDSLCTNCPSNVCTKCTANAVISPADRACKCLNGFYQSGSLCLPCPRGCASCTSPTACTACLSNRDGTGANTRRDFTQNCACLPGLYDVSSSPVCERCAASCVTCTGSNNNCLSCNTAAHFTLQGTQCVCQDGYYMLNDGCVPCNSICTTCAVSSVYCLSCPPLRALASTSNPLYKTCNCNAALGYVEVNYVCIDAKCSTIHPKCQTCSIDLETLTDRQCLSCIDNRIVVNGVCTCKPGFFQDASGNCKQCGKGCQQCLNAASCKTCPTNSYDNGDGSCTCKSGSMLVSFSGTLYCQPCNSNCATCEGASTNCKSCRNGFTLEGGRCVCYKNTYQDGSQCAPCPQNCYSCSANSKCNGCVPGYILDATASRCVLKCGLGTFNAGCQCAACSTGCLSCTSKYSCSSCDNGYNLYAGSCRDQCPQGTYAKNRQCISCDSKCSQCNSQTQCKSCKNPYVLLGDQCVNDCIPGTYAVDRKCLACNDPCVTCSGTANTCRSCPKNQVLYNQKCYNSCPVATVNGVCTSDCPAGTYLNGNQCSRCDPVCRTCVDKASSCTSCATSLSYNGACVNVCPKGTTALNGFCATCDVSCQQCSGTIFNCVQCANGYIRSANGGCTNRCPIGSFVDLVNKKCSACGLGCRKCTSLNQCSLCTDPLLTPLNGICKKVCPPGAILVVNNCVCSLGAIQNNVCVSSCSNGYYIAANKQCLPCAVPCYTCTTSANTCSSCISGYMFDAFSKTCKPTSSCPYGAYADADGKCQKYCPKSCYLEGCIVRCPTGYQTNEHNGCVPQPNPTFCQGSLFQHGSSCVNSCPNGYWGNSRSRACQACPSSCQQCWSSTTCYTCMPGFSLSADQKQCVSSSACSPSQVQYMSSCYPSCPYGTFQQGQTCVRSCPKKSYFYKNMCYPVCPTPYSSDEACLQQPQGNPTDCKP